MAKIYTPLRYPGGKSALAEFVWHTIELNGFTEIPYWGRGSNEFTFAR